jgi:hypothetical protein
LDSRFKKVIYISNFRPAAAAAAPFALQLNQFLGAGIEIYQVVKDKEQKEKSGQLRGMINDYCGRLQCFRPNIKDEWCDPAFEMERIISPEQVLEKSLDPSVLMVVGAAETATLNLHLYTSYPYRLLANAACPILTVHSEAKPDKPLPV